MTSKYYKGADLEGNVIVLICDNGERINVYSRNSAADTVTIGEVESLNTNEFTCPITGIEQAEFESVLYDKWNAGKPSEAATEGSDDNGEGEPQTDDDTQTNSEGSDDEGTESESTEPTAEGTVEGSDDAQVQTETTNPGGQDGNQ